ncbi:hypothetical protein [Limnohabitans sp. T6-20]|uniref:hypothetical protein n=1 Tax=Limnohabitans sp. T6-20 TaxID=1100725 RepID=UPI00130482B0|nr:hypothetical protein [Limnohabitans sp. T6-20]
MIGLTMPQNLIHSTQRLPEPLLSAAELQALLHGVFPESAADCNAIAFDSGQGADDQRLDHHFPGKPSQAPHSQFIAI